MKLCELIRKYSFDTIVPELIAQDPKSGTQLAWYKQAYDTLLETIPSDDVWEIEVVRKTDEKEDGQPHAYVHALHCEGMPWDGCLGSEVVIRDGIPEVGALARILWGMTFYGYTEEDRATVFDTPVQNAFQRKAEYLRNRQFLNYSYGLAGEFNRKHRALTLEDWNTFHRRKAHRNRTKRMRDARQERSIARLDRAGKVQSAIDRFRPGDHETLKYLFDTRQILELRFGSHVSEEQERIGYIAELITKYFHQDLSIYTRCEVLITTAPNHPVSSNEIHVLHSVIAPLLGMSPDEGKSSGLRFFHQMDEALGHNVKLFLVLSR